MMKKCWVILLAFTFVISFVPVGGGTNSSISVAEAAGPVNFGNLTGSDELGRAIPEYGQAQVGPRSNRYVGIFYFMWMGHHGTAGPYDITQIRLTDPNAVHNGSSPLWGALQGWHFWGKPLYDYYLSDDAWVLRKHVQQLTDASVDFLVFDATNAFTYKAVYDKLFAILDETRLKGHKVPKFVFYTNSSSGATITSIYNDIYAANRYPDLWFQWKGKPMIIGDPTQVSSTIQNFFTFRLNQWPNEGQKTNGFPWMEFQKPQRVFYNNLGEKEVINVSIAQHQATISMSDTPFYGFSSNWGRSYRNGANDFTAGAVNWGYNAADQWDFAIAQDPQIIFVTGWNEWVAQRQSPVHSSRPIMFVDLATQDFSRDAEPMKDGYGDNYYMQLMSNINKFKGLAPQHTPSAAQTVTINTTFSQWTNVTPEYRDYIGDTVNRNHGGWGGVTYTNTTGRNDIDTAKVARDNTNVYFYAKTVNALSAYSSAKWMRLFIDTDGDLTNGWKGYDYMVNRTGVGATTTTVERSTGGWNWTSVGSANYTAVGNEMHLAIPRSIIGLSSLTNPITMQFKWSDNMQTDGSVMDFYVNGDAAPDGRLNFVYTEAPAAVLANLATGKTTTTNNSIAGWGPEKATDGGQNSGVYSTSNYASANVSATPVWLNVDLGSNQTFKQVKLFPRNDVNSAAGTSPNFPVNFTIQTSTNGTTYTTVRTITSQPNPNRVAQLYSFAPVTARHVRIHVTTLGSPASGEASFYRLQLNEMEVLGTNANLALNKAATSNNTNPGWTPALATNGTPAGGIYSSNAFGSTNVSGTPVWLKVDLGSNQAFNQVKLYPRTDVGGVGGGSANYPVNFTIQTSLDGTTFTTALTMTNRFNPNGVAQVYNFPTVTSRHVRVNVTTLGAAATDETSSYRLQLAEMEVYNATSGTAVIANGGFEAPTTANFTYGPFTNGWTHNVSGGVQRNGSAFGALTAPQGVQTSLLQNNGEISQVVNFYPGTYTISFKAAKRATGSTQTFNVYYDATLIGTYTPASTSYTSYTTSAFTATPGNHTIKFVGTVVTDATDFIDDVKIN